MIPIQAYLYLSAKNRKADCWLSTKRSGIVNLFTCHFSSQSTIQWIRISGHSRRRRCSTRMWRIHCIYRQTRPCLLFSKVSLYSRPNADNVWALNRVLKICMNSNVQELSSVSLEIEPLSFTVSIDASFAWNPNYSSQLGFLLCVMNN